jgi:hypothetical protein
MKEKDKKFEREGQKSMKVKKGKRKYEIGSVRKKE